ncbi:glycoside hydrolase [Aspergillus coremiiformis]|uniref:Glycoside hydrolase n=1 Tax=Aspergillus coremiiformis TaxID=138285 RepID=A0A5N6Z5E5_9EURO|nr:glycoside hydrolase [Aspergillus coremiiformis]
MMSKILSLTSLLASVSLVAGHGYVSGIVIGGKYYGGYLVDKYSYSNNPPETIGWSTSATDLGFVDGSGYQSPDIVCHKSGKPGALTADAPAGSQIEMQWTKWPESHHGPVITYLASCGGDCSKVDKNSLKFFKIDAKGLVDGSKAPGTWATDNMISKNNTWSLTLPSSVPNGNYVLRHEIIALHSAGQKNGAQNYVQCINIKVTGGGGSAPAGTAGQALYKDSDPGIQFNLYGSLSGGYPIPGPSS